MIRYAFIENQVLKIYYNLPKLVFPLDVQEVIQLIPDCKYMSYQKLAEITNSSLEDVISLCGSRSGCTHYEIENNRYLILCNQSTDDNNNVGRQRWTCGHEVGHVLCGHHLLLASAKLAENSFLQVANPEHEREADVFAATLLAPPPLFSVLNVHSPIDVQDIFGLSAEASLYRYKQFLKWKASHRKTSWENDIVNLYYRKNR